MAKRNWWDRFQAMTGPPDPYTPRVRQFYRDYFSDPAFEHAPGHQVELMLRKHMQEEVIRRCSNILLSVVISEVDFTSRAKPELVYKTLCEQRIGPTDVDPLGQHVSIAVTLPSTYVMVRKEDYRYIEMAKILGLDNEFANKHYPQEPEE